MTLRLVFDEFTDKVTAKRWNCLFQRGCQPTAEPDVILLELPAGEFTRGPVDIPGFVAGGYVFSQETTSGSCQAPFEVLEELADEDDVFTLRLCRGGP